MADHHQQAVKRFLDAWIPEFEKSVEMFTGETVKVVQGADGGHEASAQSSHSLLWQAQTFEHEEVSGLVWVGIPADTCTEITEKSAEDLPAREALYRELLKQSFEGAAHVLSAGQTPRLVCKPEITEGVPAPDLTLSNGASLAMPGKESVPVLLSIEPKFADWLVATEQAGSEDPEPAKEARESQSDLSRPMDRLADLELPIAVVLGRASMKIREVLKLTAGSLVELECHAGDPVEVVVHNAIVARGEVVSISGNYGVRILEVISRSDRFAIHANAPPRRPRSAPQPTVN